MNFCPIPHTTRDQVWLGVGLVAGAAIARTLITKRAVSESEDAAPLVKLSSTLSGRKQLISDAVPKRLFKLAVKSEVDQFEAAGSIESTLDKADGFVHLSDRTSPPKVAGLFFKGATDLFLIELDSTKLSMPSQWILGQMGDTPPSSIIVGAAPTTVHYLVADGCVHVYGSSVSWSAVSRPPQHLPLDENGTHVMPAWL
mmetsp:Transcript_30657/g.79630  ORF Transcript_30657/g.79630 Transcript_30657/m.79630 type:complete len:199 (+) Transcript_30657:175-771(+)|eukprot:CAMPEP_0115869124 /NCGR_PEP_ID=MMETSP0287-20121206/21649_1 /TAXON_ID=412157 /ORGANISM="Chrysochromulina rotalis, Strain UIO044" /LENGTH=198 /DNA_ID=CAMNT_0003323805 /DNA_START=108 /DNA_END=704 /DNA_ORIENTATION=-